jgi:hypothetical protein
MSLVEFLDPDVPGRFTEAQELSQTSIAGREDIRLKLAAKLAREQALFASTSQGESVPEGSPQPTGVPSSSVDREVAARLAELEESMSTPDFRDLPKPRSTISTVLERLRRGREGAAAGTAGTAAGIPGPGGAPNMVDYNRDALVINGVYVVRGGRTRFRLVNVYPGTDMIRGVYLGSGNSTRLLPASNIERIRERFDGVVLPSPPEAEIALQNLLDPPPPMPVPLPPPAFAPPPLLPPGILDWAARQAQRNLARRQGTMAPISTSSSPAV